MTAEWELALQKIETGESNAKTFQIDMETYAAAIIKELLQTSITQTNLPKLNCPKCKSHRLIISDKIL